MNWQERCDEMVREQIFRRGVRDEKVLAVMRATPRHLFVPTNLRPRAYQDGPLSIGWGQTISQPYIVAAMTELLELHGDEHVLEVGCGSGYQAAVLAGLAAQVISVERHAALAEKARQALAGLGLANVIVLVGDGSAGWPALAPYDAILVTAAAPRASQALLEQLAEGGRLVLPVGGKDGQDLQRWRRTGARFRCESVFSVSFVPLRGAQGWDETDWGRPDE